MENFEQQTKIIDLGKSFVNELGLDPGVDTFSKWMAHYIAEKMTLAKSLPPGQDKSDAEKECFETILTLWKHRWTLPSGKRPLEEFEPILKYLERLKPENQEPYFFQSFERELSEIESENPNLKAIVDHVNVASHIDKVARICIDFCLQQAALGAINEKTKAILKNAITLNDNDDLLVIRVILDNDPTLAEPKDNDQEILKKHRIEKLKKRIKELETFSKLNDAILQSYKEEVASL